MKSFMDEGEGQVLSQGRIFRRQCGLMHNEGIYYVFDKNLDDILNIF